MKIIWILIATACFLTRIRAEEKETFTTRLDSVSWSATPLVKISENSLRELGYILARNERSSRLVGGAGALEELAFAVNTKAREIRKGIPLSDNVTLYLKGVISYRLAKDEFIGVGSIPGHSAGVFFSKKF